ncbi:hypothetical protein P3S67_012236 [Capsicum chacoense]
MSFTLAAAQELGIPQVFFWTFAACGTLRLMNYSNLVDKGYIQLKDESYLTNGYLQTNLDWIPDMKYICLRDLPSFLRTANPYDYMSKVVLQDTERSIHTCAIVFNTFEPLEKEVLDSLKIFLPPIYVIGPLHLLMKHVDDKKLVDLGSNLWKEEPKYLEWLGSKKPNSVVYVNFESITIMNLK